MCKLPSLIQQADVQNAIQNMVDEDLSERGHDYIVAYNESKENPTDQVARKKKVRCNRRLREKLDELGIAYTH